MKIYHCKQTYVRLCTEVLHQDSSLGQSDALSQLEANVEL